MVDYLIEDQKIEEDILKELEVVNPWHCSKMVMSGFVLAQLSGLTQKLEGALGAKVAG